MSRSNDAPNQTENRQKIGVWISLLVSSVYLVGHATFVRGRLSHCLTLERQLIHTANFSCAQPYKVNTCVFNFFHI